MNPNSSATTPEGNRIFLWDNIKFLLILLVVIGHFVSPYTGKSHFFSGLFAFIYSFHMPLFIFVSGYFHKNEKIIEKIYFFVLVRLILRLFIFTELAFLGEKPKFNVFIIPDITWFMFAMAAFVGLAYLLRNIDCKFVLLMSVIVACIAGYDKTINDYLASSRILVYFPYYVAGIWAHKNGNFIHLDSGMRNKWIYCLVILAWFFGCIWFLKYIGKLTPFFTGRHPYSSSYYYWGGIIRLLSYSIVAAVSYAIIKLTPGNYIPKISEIGGKSLQIYFWHKIFLNILLHFNILNLCSSVFGRVVYIVIAIVLTFLLSNKIFGFPIVDMKKICLKGSKHEK